MTERRPLLPVPRQLPVLGHRAQALLKLPIEGLRFDMDVWTGVTYGPAPQQQLDVWELNDLAPRDGWPAVLFVHGGGWVSGSRDSFQFQAPLLARRGVLSAAASYRLGEQGPWPTQLEDIIAAIESLESMQVDPRRIALWGVSAGGHLALLAAQHLGPERIQAVVTVGAPTDLGRLDRDRWPELGVVFGDMDLKAASPALLEAPLPPVLALHGAWDSVVPVEQSHRLAAAHPGTQVRVVAGADHLLRTPAGWWALRHARSWLSKHIVRDNRRSKWRRNR